MSSRTIIYYLYAGFFLLALNIWAYYGSDTYKDFINTIKYGSSVKVTDDITPQQEKTQTFSTGMIMTGTGVKTQTGTFVLTGSISGTGKVLGSGSILAGTGISLSPDEELVVNTFNDYKLKRLLVHPSLFDMTTEYPSEYFEYYSEPVSLYVFSNKTYKQVVDIFEAFATELPFLLNKTSSFGTNSFFMNVKPEFQDGYVRIVFEYKQKVFGLKIKKDEYNKVRILLKNLR